MRAEAAVTKSGGISKARGKRTGMVSHGQITRDAEEAARRATLIRSLSPNEAVERMLRTAVAHAEAAAAANRAVRSWQEADFNGTADERPSPEHTAELAVLRGAQEAALKARQTATDECIIVLTDGTPIAPLAAPSPVAKLLVACQPFAALEAVLNGQAANGDELILEVETHYGRREIKWRDVKRLKRAIGEVCFP